ncbi:MAG: rhomboid family intramembrane serine protease [Coraliomargarita sp.]|nr:rhomboid family intramembrane serine protease [Coraliomargarita sp.]
MLYDRPYMRQSHKPEPKPASAHMILLFVTVGVFVLQQLLNVFFPGSSPYDRSNTFMRDWLALSPEHFREIKVWTIWTYSFLHSTSGFFHILGNMLGLFFIGRIIEPILGRDRFFALYFGGAVLGGVVYLACHFNAAPAAIIGGKEIYSVVVGASAAVLALLAFFCLLRPEQPITLLLFFVLPVTVKPKWVFWIMLGGSALGLLAHELPGTAGGMQVAHSAHLGGMLAGIVFYRYAYLTDGLAFLTRRKRKDNTTAAAEPPSWFKRRPKATRELNYSVNRDSREQLQAEVDRILDKINSSGFGALTDGEKATLDRAKEILSK